MRSCTTMTMTMAMATTMAGVILFLAFPVRAQVVLDLVPVGDPGNLCDSLPNGCFGSVADEYRISAYETTNAQYAEFLNAVAADDANGLYNVRMGNPFAAGGIPRSGSPGSYTYGLIPGLEDWPVNWVSFWDALRFANWMHNGQPTGLQDTTTTEDGAYTITAQGIADNSITRNPGAAFFLTSEDEWYKAAYYDTVSMGYFNYPAGTDSPITCALPDPTMNRASCQNVVGSPTVVGSYTGSASPNGTFDQGGNVTEWNEAIDGSLRGNRGGSYLFTSFWLSVSIRQQRDPGFELNRIGFRLAAVAEDPLIQIEIDIKPGSDINPISLKSNGVTPVAILGSDTFDVTDVDVTTLAFGPDGAAPAHMQGGHLADVNDDGFTDLLSHYWSMDTGIGFQDVEACVTGETLDAIPIEGCDHFKAACGLGFELTLLLPTLIWLRRRSRSFGRS